MAWCRRPDAIEMQPNGTGDSSESCLFTRQFRYNPLGVTQH